METNPNEYDDARFLAASNDLHSAIAGLWAAGASEDDIDSEVSNAKENV